MSLRLRDVSADSGLRWLGDAFRLFKRRPLALTMMLASFFVLVIGAAWLPVAIGIPLILMTPPLLGLGVMIAAQSALLDGPVHPGLFLQPLRGDARRRNQQLLLCALYGICVALIGWVCFAVGGETAAKVAELMTSQQAGDSAHTQQMSELLISPEMRSAVSLFNLLIVLLSVPFWHAPALVYWGSQSAGQALFSSTLALWRAKWAFARYGLAWVGISAGVGLLSSLVIAILGPNLVGLAASLAVLLCTWTVFYVSVLFTFNDSFGGAVAAVEPAAPA